jgi:predicted DNA-binding transcriptional regulator AlpA
LNPNDLVGLTEIAEICDVHVSAVSNWRKRDWVDFPQPWGTWHMGSLWEREVIEEWIAARIAARMEAKARRIRELEAQLERLKNV